MKFKKWFAVRGSRYVQHRTMRLLGRYQISPSKSYQRIDACLEGLVNQGCFPTFPTPGIVVQHHPIYFQHLQSVGAEIAVHGYQHVDLSTFPIDNAHKQLGKAASTFKKNEIKVHGFRCPYLGYSEELLDTLPKGLFGYSSNQAIYWKGLNSIDSGSRNGIFDTLQKMYGAVSSSNTTNVPWSRPNMIEIPVSMPDDMELFDGLNLTPEEVATIWCQVLKQTHERGELFNLIFHPELAMLCEQPFFEVLSCAKLFKPSVWIAKLCDISEWWAEKSRFKVETTLTSLDLRMDFTCSQRATILVKGFDLRDSGTAWDGSYQRLQAKILEMPASPRPFLGLSAKTPQKVINFLMEQGYILDTTETAPGCGIYVDEAILANQNSETALINYIEASTAPLVRYWRWPDGAKSALSITGDLDALSLLDYLSRLYKT